MPDLGFPELIIVVVVLLLLFGPGKAADLGGTLGRSVREFRKASLGDEVDTTALSAPGGRLCNECGTELALSAAFCGECGARVVTAAPV